MKDSLICHLAHVQILSVIGEAVGAIDDFARVAPSLAALAAQDVEREVLTAHLPAVRMALLDTLQRGLALRWTPAANDAWIAFWTMVMNPKPKTCCIIKPCKAAASSSMMPLHDRFVNCQHHLLADCGSD